MLPLNAPELIGLPVLTVHKVFDDLPRTSILAIASLKNHHLDECILTHLLHRKSFPTAAALEAARDAYILVDEIRRTIPSTEYQDVWNTIDHPSGYNPHAVHARTVRLIDSLSPSSPDYYAQFSPPASNIWDSSTFALVRSRFAAVVSNGNRLQAEKLSQMHRLHAIYETHHNLVRKKLDPSQVPRPKPMPLLQRLQRQRKMLESPFSSTTDIVGPSSRALGLDRDVRVWMNLGRWVPVPFDRYLIMLLKVLEKYPLPDEAMPGLTLPNVEQLDKTRRAKVMSGVRLAPVVPEYFSEGEEYICKEVSDDDDDSASAGKKDPAATTTTAKTTKKMKYLFRSKPTHKHKHIYPPAMISNVRTTLIGLKHTYSVPGVAPRARTLYTPYSAPENQSVRRLLQPCFARMQENEPLAYAVNWKEIEWLEAFLACCDYMGAMEERWSRKMTMAEWWKSKEFVCG